MIPRPNDPVHAAAPGPDPIRVLLIGGAQAVGYGVLESEFSLQGFLARQMSELLGHGVEIQVVANNLMTVSAATECVQSANLARFDVVLFMLGTTESMMLTAMEQWTEQLRQLLAAVAATAPPQLCQFVTTVPRIYNPRVLGAKVAMKASNAHARLLDVPLRETVGRSADMHLLPFATDVFADPNRRLNPETYRLWAAQLAPGLSRAVRQSSRFQIESGISLDLEAEIAQAETVGAEIRDAAMLLAEQKLGVVSSG